MVVDRKAEFPGEEAVKIFIGQVLACSPPVAEQILRHGRLKAFANRTTILRQGDTPSLTYLVIVGRAHALIYTSDGQAILLHEFHPGDLFGTLGELDAVQQDSDVIAVDDVSALLLAGSELARLAQQHGCIGLALSRMLIRQLRLTTARIYERAALSAVGRVYSELLRLARPEKDFCIRPAPVLSELALRVGTTRETASRAVNALERRGIIRRELEELTIVAPHRLEELIL